MTRANSYATVRLLAVLVTACVIAAHQHLPPKVVQIFPYPGRPGKIYGPEHQGTPSATWIDQDKAHFRCNYAPGDTYSCGWSLVMDTDETKGLDLSGYDGFNIVMYYKGNAPRIRPYLRNFDLAYSDPLRPGLTGKVMATAIRTRDLNKPVYVRASELSVAEWWLTEFDIPRQHSVRSMDNVVIFAFDFNVHSDNEVRIEKIEAVGEWIDKESLYFLIISAWMGALVLELFSRFYAVKMRARAEELRLSRLSNEYKKLEVEKQEFEALSTTDVLTGVMNRAGVQQFMQKLFESEGNWSEAGVLLFDIDHFKKINDGFGHDVGDAVLKEVAKIINANIRKTDIFGRWGGEEFILICPQVTEERLKALAEKLGELIAQQVVEASGHTLQVTVSIGATIVGGQESFEAVFKRADQALYQAKHNGRNQVQFA